MTSVALIGAGGIGKTSIALTVLHHDRVKERFGENRRFLRCDQFPPSRASLLTRLSEVLGAGVENPVGLISLQPPISSTELLIILDNAECILDPQGANWQEIHDVVEELSQLDGVCLCITSRIATKPRNCKRLSIPTLSKDAARSAFHRIYGNDEQSNLIDDILKQLDFHPLSVTLLATVARQNDWDNGQLVREWEHRQTGILQTEHGENITAAIELSLASPMFKGLGPNARELLGVIAFFPQGVDENNVGWLFPTIPDVIHTFNNFCMLSLTYRRSGFITMLWPLRDCLRPKDPKSSSLLCATKEHYFTRMATELRHNESAFRQSRWIRSEDVNVEYLLDVFTSIDPDSNDTWDACNNFMSHLYCHKPRQTLLGAKVEGLPDDHHSKPTGLFQLSALCEAVGNHMERKRLLAHLLKIQREQESDCGVAEALTSLSDANRLLGFQEEGIQQTEEALGIFGQLGDTLGQARCLKGLAWLLWGGQQLEAAEDAATRAINLLPENGQEWLVCKCHRVLGDIYLSKGEKEKAIHHLEAALTIASPFRWNDELFWIHYTLTELSLGEDEFDEAHAHVERAKEYAVDDEYYASRGITLQAWIWYRQRRFEEAMQGALYALGVYEKLGAAGCLEPCRDLLRAIKQAMENQGTFDSGCDTSPSGPVDS